MSQVARPSVWGRQPRGEQRECRTKVLYSQVPCRWSVRGWRTLSTGAVQPPSLCPTRYTVDWFRLGPIRYG